jgi:CheY-like chemotaxis protein
VTPKEPMVLVVEDDEDVRTVISRAFQRSGYTVRTAPDVNHALSILTQVTPDAIVTDVLMPGGSGLELVQAVRASPRTANVPIMILSARDQPADVLAGYDRGADEYVTKPVELAVLVAKVEALRRRSGRSPDAGGKQHTPATVVLFGRVKGGVGATTLAAASGALAGGMDNRTCLLDLDSYPSAAPMLGVEVPRTLADVQIAALGEMLPELLVEASPALSVVSARRGPDQAAPLGTELVMGAVEHLRQHCDLLLVDLPRCPEVWTRSLVEAADVACLVTGPQVPAVAALDEGRRMLKGTAGARPRQLLVVNRVVQSGLSIDEIVRRAGQPPDVLVPYSEYLVQVGSLGWPSMAQQAPYVLNHLADLMAAVLGAERAAVR